MSRSNRFRKNTVALACILSAPLASAQDPISKIDPAILAGTENGGQASYWIVLEPQADLRPAYSIRNWQDRGRFVHQELTAVAQAAQEGALEYLRAQGLEHRSFWIRNVILATSGRDPVLALAERQEVSRLIADGSMTVQPLPGTAEPAIATVEWNVARIRANEAWTAFGTTGQGMVVGIIDTGAEYTHSALMTQYRGNLGGGAFDHNYNWFDPSRVCSSSGSVPCDNHSHGTHTLGTVLGGDGPGPKTDDIGVAPGAKWIAAKGCEGSFCSFSALMASGQWMVAPTDLSGQNPDPDRRPHVVNNSWAGGGGSTFYQGVVDAWRAAGIFPAFANGNSGSSCGSVASPADYPESFGVGATDSADLAASFSSRGPSDFGPIKPDACAPGVNVRSSVPQNSYAVFSGTSMASPHVTGAVALIWARFPHLVGDIEATSALLKSTARSRSDSSCGGDADGDPNNVYGEGRIDVVAALEAASPSLTFRRGGDCFVEDGGADFNLTDAVALLSHLFIGSAGPSCLEACDVQNDGTVDLADPISMLQFLFLDGPAPLPPYPGCGSDSTASMACQRSSCP